MKALFISSTASLLLSACANLLPPSSSELAALPVVRYGTPAPSGQAYVLHYPADAALPVTARIGGNLLEENAESQLQVKLKKDVYLYQQWLSFNGKDWQASQQLIGGKISLHLPGEKDGRNPGELSAEFNQK